MIASNQCDHRLIPPPRRDRDLTPCWRVRA
jgi:hypothetical protein